jgi:quinol monooxygenase YgiN
LTVLSARVESTPANRRELVQALLTWLVAARREAGMADARLSEDLESPGMYCLHSEWHRRQDLEDHLGGSHFGILLGALELLGLRTHLSLTHAEAGADDPMAVVRRVRGRVPSLGQPRTATDGVMVEPAGPGGLG